MQTNPIASVLREAQTAQARCIAYDLFAGLFLEGPTNATRDYIAAAPELEKALGGLEDPVQPAADHFHLFGFNVFPYQSMFLDIDGNLGGEQSERVLNFYRQAGFDLTPNSPSSGYAAGESPDHIGLELAFLSFLSGAEADAIQDGEELHVHRIQSLQRDFFDQHLLPWLPVLVQAVGQQGLPFYSELSRLTLELACEHRAALGEGVAVRQAAFALPHPPALLENEKTSLKDIAAYLLTPAYSGIYLSRDDIARLGRSHKLPRGFGGRTQMLSNLLHSAVDYDHLPVLISDLHAVLDIWQAAYQSFAEKEPAWRPSAQAWMERLQATRTILERVASGASQVEEL